MTETEIRYNNELLFAYTRADGGVSIVGSAPKADLERLFGPLTDEQHREHVVSRHMETMPEGATGWREITADDLPVYDEFRNAWTLKPDAVEVDMPKAREIQKDKLRAMRTPILANLDMQYMRADEIGDTAAKQAIAMQKQAIRDITNDPAIDAAKTPEELKVVIPAVLIK